MKPMLFVVSDMIAFLLHQTVQDVLTMISQVFGSLEQYFITELYGNNGSMGLVRCNRYPLALFWQFSTNFHCVSCRVSSQPNQQQWFLALVKLLHFFCRMTGSQILFKNIPSSWKHSFHFSNHILSHHLALFFHIHQPGNRVKWSKNLKVEIIPKHCLFAMFNTLDDDDPLWSTSGVARLSAARGRPWKCRPFHTSNLLTKVLNESSFFVLI